MPLTSVTSPSTLGLITGAGGADPQFNGPQAAAIYALLTGQAETSVPLENTGGAGTPDIHWRELIFDHELMTGVLDAGNAPFSQLSLAALADMGYQVNLNATDPYELPGGGSSTGDGPGSALNRPLPFSHRVELVEGEVAINIDFGNTELGNVVIAPEVIGLSPTPSETFLTDQIDIDVTFNMPVLNVDASDLQLSGPASVGASVGAPVDLGGNTWRFSLIDLSNGRLDLSLAPDDGDGEILVNEATQ